MNVYVVQFTDGSWVAVDAWKIVQLSDSVLDVENYLVREEGMESRAVNELIVNAVKRGPQLEKEWFKYGITLAYIRALNLNPYVGDQPSHHWWQTMLQRQESEIKVCPSEFEEGYDVFVNGNVVVSRVDPLVAAIIAHKIKEVLEDQFVDEVVRWLVNRIREEQVVTIPAVHPAACL